MSSWLGGWGKKWGIGTWFTSLWLARCWWSIPSLLPPFGFFFLSVWASSKKAIQRCKIILRNYLWATRKQNTRTIVKWKDCCLSKKANGLGLKDSKNILSSFLCKWVMLALKLGESNLKCIIRFKLCKCAPSKHEQWKLEWQWMFSHFTSVYTRIQSLGEDHENL
jgi:hypothetical protein